MDLLFDIIKKWPQIARAIELRELSSWLLSDKKGQKYKLQYTISENFSSPGYAHTKITSTGLVRVYKEGWVKNLFGWHKWVQIYGCSIPESRNSVTRCRFYGSGKQYMDLLVNCDRISRIYTGS